MKSIFTLFLMLVITSIIITSCSQVSNSALIKSHEMNTFNIQQPEILKEEVEIYPETGYSNIRTDKDEAMVSVDANNSQISVRETTPTNGESINNDEYVIPVVNENSSFLKSDFSHSRDFTNEYVDISTLDQPVNYSNNSGRTSNGVPFFLIFLCAFFIPPLGVALMYGITDKFWICLGLTLLFWLPGMIYAMIQIFD